MKRLARRTQLALFTWLSALLIAGLAFAQEAVPVDPTSALTDIINQLMVATKAGQWLLAVPLAILLVVGGLRWLGGKLAGPETGFGKFLANQWTRWGMNFLTTFCGALVTAASAGQSVTPSLVVASIIMSLTAAGTLQLIRDVADSAGVKKAQDAGEAAKKSPGPTLNG